MRETLEKVKELRAREALNEQLGAEIAAYVVLAIVVIIGLAVLCHLFLYILEAAGTMRIASRRGVRAPGLAWVPIVNVFTLGAIVDDINARRGKKTSFRTVLLMLNIFSILLYFLGSLVNKAVDMYAELMNVALIYLVVFFVYSVVFYIIWLVCLHKIYRVYDSKNAVIFTIIGILFVELQQLLPFIVRNNPASDEEKPRSAERQPVRATAARPAGRQLAAR